MTYAIISDVHLHGWSAFATTLDDGINSRLWLLLSEIKRAVRELRGAGGDVLFVAGDVFHVRGKVSPSVLNPVQDLFEEIVKSGIRVFILAGNHDLEGESSNRLGSAITALEKVGCICVSDAPRVVSVGSDVGMIPWDEDLDRLRTTIEAMQGTCRDLIIHAPLNGVITGLPERGLDPNWLLGLNYRNIFSGHYHNHKRFERVMSDTKVFSIGALAHHSWSDVGSKAGFLLVDDLTGETTYRASHCPNFVELDSEMSEGDMQLEADGNYVKARLTTADQKTLTAVRDMLLKAGARGVTLISEPPKASVARTDSRVKKGQTLSESVKTYIEAGASTRQAAVMDLCARLLTKAEAVE